MLPAPHARGSASNPANRFDRIAVVPDPDCPPEEWPAPQTQFFHDAAASLITYNDSPDLPFRASLNLYRGCEHGCSYCYARPFHEYLGLSAGLDFETKIFVKSDAPRLLRDELASPKWEPQTVAISGVTDSYQPAERHFQLTRECLRVFAGFRNPVSIVTKSHLVVRDADVLAELARHDAARVFLSVTTLDAALARRMEPRTSSPAHRLRAIRELAAAGIPVGVMAAPMIPGLTDHELPAILAAAKDAGARYAGYIVLRLPHGVKDLFADWLAQHEPGKQARVLDRVRDVRGGKLYDAKFGTRFRGEGIFAEQLQRVFEVTARRLGLLTKRDPLSTAAFRPPGGKQLTLF